MKRKTRDLLFVAGSVVLCTTVMGLFFSDLAAQRNPDLKSTFEVDVSAVESWAENKAVDASKSGAIMIVIDDSKGARAVLPSIRQGIVAGLQRMDPETIVGIVTFRSGVVLAPARLRQVQNTIQQKLDALEASGNRRTGTAIAQAAHQMKSSAARLSTDGPYIVLTLTNGHVTDRYERQMLNGAINNIVTKTPIEIRTVGIGVKTSHALGIEGVTELITVADRSKASAVIAEAVVVR